MLRYWTIRYAVTLALGLLVIGAGSIWWLRYNALTERIDALSAFAQAAARHVEDGRGGIRVPDDLYEWIDNTQRAYRLPSRFGLTVFDPKGNRLFYKNGENTGGSPAQSPLPAATDGESGPSAAEPPPSPPGERTDMTADPLFPVAPAAPAFADRVSVKRLGGMYAVVAPIAAAGGTGTIAISYSRDALTDIEQQYGLIVSLLLLAGLLGWTILFLLLRRLRRPITGVAAALRQIEAGDYRIRVAEDVKEAELHALLVSFKAMAERLEQLEELRTELLAGVTHDLKTPITSVHGLVHAVRDGVVSGPEAEEFLDISLKETERLREMVTDLLDFHAFASGRMASKSEPLELGRLVEEVAYQWGLVFEDERIGLLTEIPREPCRAAGEASRIQQILVNLLNNAKQAIEENGTITISLTERADGTCEIVVRDTGCGIPAAEQANIFEKYFRGARKKLAVRGLGLGLTYSRMLAEAMGGKLNLADSSERGTAFSLSLPRAP